MEGMDKLDIGKVWDDPNAEASQRALYAQLRQYG